MIKYMNKKGWKAVKKKIKVMFKKIEVKEDG